MVGRDRVAEHDEAARSLDVRDGLRLARHPVEVRGQTHVGRRGIPGVQLARGCLERTPAIVAGEDVGVGGGEHLALHRPADHLVDLVAARPEVAEEDVIAVGALADRLRDEVDVHAARERVRDDERRRREVVRLHLAVDARLEVPVAGEHGADDEVTIGDGGADRLRQRTGVPDARRAAVADGVEAQRVEVRVEAGGAVVLAHHLRAGREGGLDPRPPLEPPLDRLLREQAGRDHHGRVRRVRAGRDRGDHDRAVLERVVLALDGDALLLDRRRPCGRLFRVVGHAVAGRRVTRGERVGDLLVVRPVHEVDAEGAERLHERLLRTRERDAVLRPARPRERRLDVVEIQLHDLRVLRVLVWLVPEQVLLAVRLDERDPLGTATRESEVFDRDLIDGEEAAGRAVLRAHVPERRAVGEGK